MIIKKKAKIEINEKKFNVKGTTPECIGLNLYSPQKK